MSIVKAYTLPHPPLAIPEIGKGQEKDIAKTLEAFDKVAQDIASIKPETIVFITPHSTIYADYFHISPGTKASGSFERFRAPDVRLETMYDEELTDEISRIAAASGVPAGTEGERDKSLDHGVMVPMWYINKRYTDYKSVRVSQSGLSKAEHYVLGQVIAKAAENTGRSVAVVGSSDLSHRLTEDGPYGFDPHGPEFDAAITDAIKKGDFLAMMNISENTRESAGECGYNSLMVIAGVLDSKKTVSKLHSYEGPFGVGYAVAEFSITGSDDRSKILNQYLDMMEEHIKEQRKAADPYQELARRSLEHTIKTGEKLPVPNDIPAEMLKSRAGVFVSLHINEKLRGCIGTIAPTTQDIASEIIQNAISAGLSDTRFPQVTIDELPLITYKVDVLKTPEPISSSAELDVKKYGVIVKSGMKRGLLLPNLDGVDTVEQQIEIASQKAGIRKGEHITLERFEVIRHE